MWPEINIGTIIYDNNKKNPKEIKWKVNRAFVFSRKDKSTWHSYGSNGLTTRSVAIFTLRTKKLDRALIIDRGFIIFLIKKIRSFFYKRLFKQKQSYLKINIMNLKSGSWSFGGKIPDKFEKHIAKSVPLYLEGHKLIASLSDYFLLENSNCYDIGCSTGNLLNKL